MPLNPNAKEFKTTRKRLQVFKNLVSSAAIRVARILSPEVHRFGGMVF